MNNCKSCSMIIPEKLNFCSYNCLLDFKNKKETTILYIRFRKIKEFGKNIKNDRVIAQVYIEEIRKLCLKNKNYKKMSFDRWLKWKGIENVKI